MSNRFVIDWLSFTTKIHTPEQVISLLGLDDCPWETIKGACGYRDRLYCSFISIHFNGSEDMGVWCEMSGKGCRAFEDFGHGDYGKIFDLLLFENHQMNITRLDIAFDDLTGIFDIDELCRDTMEQKFISKWKKYEVIFSNGGNSILHGSRKSDALLRIYDKASEQKVSYHWVRLELQLRDDRAAGFLRALKASLYGLGYLFTSVVSNYIRYVVPSVTDTNNRRWPNTEYWDEFIGSAEKISIYEKPGYEYDITDLENFVMNQAGNAVKTYIDIVGKEKFMESIDCRRWRSNPKYETLRRMKGCPRSD